MNSPKTNTVRLLGYTGDRVPGYEYEYSFSYLWSYRYYMEFYLGYPIHLAHEGIVADLAATDTVQAMPDFPATGCTQWVGDTLVVKLSNRTY